MTGQAAVYVRISADKEGRELGVQRQEQDCRRLAERLGLEVVEVFKDNDIGASSRSRKARPEYARMLSATREGQYRAVLAYSHSRLTRRPSEMNDLIELAEKQGIRISTVASGEYDLTTAAGRAVARTIAAWDGAEAEQTAERVARAARQRAESGAYHGGPVPPFGYRREGSPTRLVPDRKDARLLNEAADRLLAGDTLYSICNDWNARGLTTSAGKIWRSRTLKRALMTRSVLGETSAGVQGWKPILDRKTYDRLQRLFEDPSRMTFRATSESSRGKLTMTGGLAVCAVCGKNLVGQKYRGAYRLICHKQATGGCGTVTVQHGELEEYVFEQVLNALTKNPRWSARLAEPVERDQSALEALEDQRSDLVEQGKRANDAFVRGFMPGADHAATVSRITKEREDVERRITALLGQEVLAEGVEDGLRWESWSPLRRRNFLRQLVARVEIQRWPDGRTTYLAPRTGESKAAHAARNAANRREALEQRVRIVPR